MEHFKKLLEKKKAEGKSMSPMEQKSKMSMLKALKNEMGGMMSEDLSPENMKKVTVASNDQEGLKAGLDKAKKLVSHSSGMAEGGMVEGDKTGPEDAGEHAEYAASDVDPESKDLPEDPRGEPSGDDEEVEMHIGKYLEEPSEENLDALRATLDKKKMSHQE